MKNLKKVLVLFASPHENGNTKKLLNLFIKSFENQFEINFFDTYRQTISPCVDCKKCFKTGRCIFNDLETLNDNLEKSDIIVIASPVYNLGFPAPLKSILDRFQMYYNFYMKNNRCKFEKKKDAILLLTCGRRKNKMVIDFLEKQLKCILKYLNCQKVHKVVWDNTDFDLNFSEHLLREMKEITDLLQN